MYNTLTLTHTYTLLTNTNYQYYTILYYALYTV